MYSGKEREGGEGSSPGIVTTDNSNGCLKAAIRSEGCVLSVGVGASASRL